MVDRRTPGLSPELSVDIGFKRTRTVHVHPVNRHYFLAAGSVYVTHLELVGFSVGQLGLSSFSASTYSQSCLSPSREQIFSS